MLAELERDFISERTKEGLKARVAKGIKLGKPKGVLQKSQYDADFAKIMELYQKGVPIKRIRREYLRYGHYLSLRNYILKCRTPLN